MALAYGNFHELSHQLRFLLFEIGIGLSQAGIDHFITFAHHNALKRLQHAALAEGLIHSPIASHHVHDFIDQLQVQLEKSLPQSQFFQWNTMRNELDESIANDAMASAYKYWWNNQLRKEATQYKSLWSWLKAQYDPHEGLLLLEQWGDPGHAYAPTFRAKIGFTRREVIQNSAEFQAKISIHWCALIKSMVTPGLGSNSFNQSIAAEFPQEHRLWEDKLRCLHLNPENYYPLPVHPWQWRNRLQSDFAQHVDDKTLVLLPHHQMVMPCLSKNSAMPIHSSTISLKFGMDIPGYETDHYNSDITQSISLWLHTLLKKLPHDANKLLLMTELAHYKFSPLKTSTCSESELAVSLHDNSLKQCNSEHKIVPLRSLFTYSPVTNSHLLIEIINSSGLDPLLYFANYCQMILQTQLYLLLKHGIAFFTQQNECWIAFTNNQPHALIIKNLEQIKISYHDEYDNQDKPQLVTGATPDQLRNTFIESTLQNNISFWVDALNVHWQRPVQQLWQTVHQTLQQLFKQLSAEIDPEFLSWERYQLFNNAWQHPCHFTEKLSACTNKPLYRKQTNPLGR